MSWKDYLAIALLLLFCAVAWVAKWQGERKPVYPELPSYLDSYFEDQRNK